MKRRFKFILTILIVLLIVLCGIGIGYVIYNKKLDFGKIDGDNVDSLSVEDIYKQKINEGYSDVIFPKKLSSVYRVLTDGTVDSPGSVYKNSGYFHSGDAYGTMNYDNNLKKIYIDVNDEKKYFDIENVKSFFIYAEGTAVGFEHLFIITNDGYLYYNYGLLFETLDEALSQINNLEKIKLNNIYDEIVFFEYNLTPANYNDWELIGIKDGEMYSIGYYNRLKTTEFIFDEKKFENERFDYVYQDFSMLYGEGNNYFEIEKNGKIKLFQSENTQSHNYSDIKVKNILSTIYAESVIFIGEDDYLYSISDNNVLVDRNSKVKYALENDKNVVVIFEDGSIKELNIELATY